ncbi:MAG: DUF455 family protein [Verrucomicrobiales bacterium]
MPESIKIGLRANIMPEHARRAESSQGSESAAKSAVESAKTRVSVRSMTAREFAERVLFSTTLEEKLAPPPESLDFGGVGSALAGAPGDPGRPADLALQPPGSRERADFPGAARLRDERDRGVLLHFLANHELLATELMALALLKFPDAPAAFRKGLVRTLCDEQEHTRLYMARMAACGLRLGDLPVNRYFWDAVSTMESPLDYVSRLSLTFEQANLDFARFFGAAFAQAGDAPTAALLDRIYRDEIAHVGYGLKWFRRWKAPGDSEWEAFGKALPFPLSPARAKGAGGFNAEGRRRAGLGDAFIAELRAFQQSRGRTPNVFWFNPCAEASVAAGKPHPMDALERAAQADLALLMIHAARRDDVVAVPQRPGPEFLASLETAGFPLPEILGELDAATLAERKPRAAPAGMGARFGGVPRAAAPRLTLPHGRTRDSAAAGGTCIPAWLRRPAALTDRRR